MLYKKKNSVAIPTERQALVDEVNVNLRIQECRVVSSLDPHTRNRAFLDWSCYFFFQVAPQLYS
jgi:hypothetical protein